MFKSNTFFDGTEITKENLLRIIEECMMRNWYGSDLREETQKIFELFLQGYDGVDEDIEYIIDVLNSKNMRGEYFYPLPNLQDIESIISQGEWYFQKVFKIEQKENFSEIWHNGEKIADIEENNDIYLYKQPTEELLSFFAEIFGVAGKLVPAATIGFWRWQPAD